MELRHLRYFKAVAELLNFSRAAERLRVAQPALSRQIKALEDELGAQLLDRNRVRVQLTDAGRTFYAHTCKVLAEVDLAVAAVQEVTAGTGGELILCNDWRLGSDFVPATIAAFQAQHPRAEVTLRDLRLHEQLPALRARRAHLGFLVRDVPGARTDLESLLVLESNLVVVLSAKHRLAGASLVKLADLADDTWVMIDPEEAPDYRGFLIQLCRLRGFTPRFGRSADTLEGVLGRVASGYGVALTLEHTLPRPSPLLRFLPTDCAPIELCAVWHRLETSTLLRDYLAILRQHVEQAGTVAPSRVSKRPEASR